MPWFLRLGVLWESTGERGTHLGTPERHLGGGYTGADTESGIWNTDFGQLWVLHRLG